MLETIRGKVRAGEHITPAEGLHLLREANLLDM